MKILYLSTLISPDALREAEIQDPSFSAYAVQKFHALVTKGLVKNGVEVVSFSSFYLPNVGHVYRRKKEKHDGMRFEYIMTPQNQILRHIWLIIRCFFRVLAFGCSHRMEKAIICDVLNISACLGAVSAAKILGLRRVGLVTDMPEEVICRSPRGKQSVGRMSFEARLSSIFIGHFTHYVFLTEQMNKIINKNNRPYVVMEGLVDSSFVDYNYVSSSNKKTVLYAGGLSEKYGLRLLIEGFIMANVLDSELHLYGDGPFVEQIKQFECSYPNIQYRGIQTNEEIIKKEIEATLLVNPRPTKERFTKYSFPSKNMEYMLSGTPVLTTKLQGMPIEYYPYVFLFEEETVLGYSKMINYVLNLPKKVLINKGEEAKRWVLEQKNNVVQAKKILDLVFKG